MTFPRALAVVCAAALAVPALASAGVRIETRDAAIRTDRAASGSARVAPAQTAPFRFDMVGLHWLGRGSVEFRVAPTAGSWGPWQNARPEGEDLPDARTAEARAAGRWTLGNPYWTGSARRIQYRTTGSVSRIRAFFLQSPVETAPRTLARAGRPAIISRKGWGANESIVRARPQYASRIAFAVVHHTAGAQPSSRAESAAMVRGIQTYHVKGNGWNDIGYNFLVDRFGQIFEGRGGGMTRNVVGAHAEGFNTGSVGVAVIGTYESSGIGAQARSALASVVSWRLDLAHVNPLGRTTWRSGGNARFPVGKAVRLRRISGHRDTGYTSCPGNALYAQLPGIAAAVRALGLPKIYRPAARGRLGGPVRFTAVVDPATRWTVTVTNSAGATVASRSGKGTALDWTWNSAGTPKGAYRWTMSAGTARPATGAVGSGVPPPPPPPPPLELTTVAATPAVVTPNGDGVRDTTTLSWQTTAPAEVRILIRNAGGVVAKAMRWRKAAAGSGSFVWSGLSAAGAAVPDGRYTLRFRARTATENVYSDVPVVVDRTLASLSVAPSAFSPNGDGRRDSVTAAFDLAAPARTTVRVFREGTSIATVFSGPLDAGHQTVSWDGMVGGQPVPDGIYRLRAVARTDLGTRGLSLPVTVDTTPPAVTGLTVTQTGAGTRVAFVLSEPGRALVWFDETGVWLEAAPGQVSLRRPLTPRLVRVRSWDAAGNRSRLKRRPLG